MPNQAVSPFDFAFSTCEHIVECQRQAHTWYELVCISTRGFRISLSRWQQFASLNTLFVDGILYGDSRVIGKRIRCDRDGIL